MKERKKGWTIESIFCVGLLALLSMELKAVAPSQKPLAPSVASVTSVANNKGENETILGRCAQISWHLPYSRGKPQKTLARRSSHKGAVRPVIASNGVHFLQMRSVGSHSTSGRER